MIEPLTAATSRVRLLHDYRAVDDDPAGLEWIDRAVDRNSGAELAALRPMPNGPVTRRCSPSRTPCTSRARPRTPTPSSTRPGCGTAGCRTCPPYS
ncbi:hypothetical protein [Streptomyces thioluteus]|uniref:hypothetical protein n=1 Tax=Streptomyces thioluteus TaxID=66431 RepID=UPI003CD0BCE1